MSDDIDDDFYIRVPRPHVLHGPIGVPAQEADARYLRQAARNIRHARVCGSNLTDAVCNLLNDVAAVLHPEAPPAEVEPVTSVAPIDVPCEHCGSAIGQECGGPKTGAHPVRWALASLCVRTVRAIEAERSLSPFGQHLRWLYRNGSPLVRVSEKGYVPCAHEHEPNRVCVLPLGHGQDEDF